MIKKKVKKIPKYNNGGIAWKDMTTNQKWSTGVDAFAGVADLIGTATSGQNVTVGGALGSMASGAAKGAAFGPIGAIGGAILGGIAGTAGRKHGYDANSNSTNFDDIYKEGSGWLSWLGPSSHEAKSDANLIQSVNIAKQQTESARADYTNNPNVQLNPVLVAEGGIVPGEHYASRGEVEVAADGTNAVRYGWDPRGKDTYHVYTNPDGTSAEGNMIFTEEGVKRPNGEKYSDAAEKIIKSTKEGSRLRQISLRKLANEMEEQKMNKEIKKVKKGISAYEGGTDGKEFDFENSFLYRQPDGTFVMQDINGKRTPVPEMMLPYIQGDEHGYWFGPQTGIAPSAGKWNGSMNFAKQMLNSKNVAKLKNSATRVFGRNAKPANVSGPVKPVTGTSPEVLGKPKTVQEAAQMARNERTANMWQQLTSKGSVPQKTLEGPQTWATARGSSNLWENPMALQSGDDIASAINTAYYLNKGLPTALGVSAILGGGTFLLHEATKDKRPTTANTDKSAVVTTQEKPVEPVVTSTEATTENEKKEVVVPKKSSINKPSSGKKTAASRVTTSTAPSPEDTVVRRPIYEEPVKTVTVPTDDTKVYGRDGRVAYDYTAPETKVTPQDLGRTVDDNNNYTGSNWKDNLYRMAVLSQPLWDRAKAESVDYTSPVYKYMPTQIDVSSQLRDADQSYALSRYNFANLYPNTGAGMAAGLQAASNRAKQYADIRQWQTNAQNELIGKNVGIYNNWANEHARILNDVYNKSAQNRAAARNINRQNRAAWLDNWGTILRDDNQFAADAQTKALQTEILKPLIQSVYENSDTLMPMLAQYTANKNIKKKSSTR